MHLTGFECHSDPKWKDDTILFYFNQKANKDVSSNWAGKW